MKREQVRKVVFYLALLVIVCGSSVAAFGQTRIKFVRGGVTATPSGRLNGYNSKRIYVIRVREGQTLTTEQVSGKPISIFITGPDGEEAGDMDASCHSNREITPTIAGDYKLRVVECRKADPWRGTFRFRVTVR
jgi:hypothetical protein